MHNRTYWHRYAPWFGQATIDAIERTVEDVWIESAGGQIHLSLFSHPKPAEAIGSVVVSHGIAGYGRLITPLGLRLMERGFNVVLPDLAGYGFNAARRGDWTWPQFVQNLLDTLNATQARCGGPLFLAGMSLGGPLAYYAACHRPDLAALACYCLYDYRDAEFLADVSRFGRLTPLARRLTTAAAKLLPRLRLPAELVVSYRYVAEDRQFVALLRRDPLAGTTISLRAVDSMFRAIPAIEFEQFALPTVVLQPDSDKMLDPKWSRICYERLGCEKEYVEIPNCGHWTLYPEQQDFVADALATWFAQYAEMPSILAGRSR